MSDFSIPGASSKYNVDKIVEGLMKVERKPLEKLEKQVEVYENEKKCWSDLNKQLKTLSSSAQYLYSFENPFNSKTFSSNDESYVTGSATKNAESQSFKIKVNKTAKADRFTSSNLSEDTKIEEGKYTFKTGEREVSFFFRGGSIEEFASKINARSDGLISAKVLKISPEDKVFIIESLQTGNENRLEFQNDALKFALNNQIIEKSISSSWKPDITIDSNYSENAGGILLKPDNTKFFSPKLDNAGPNTELTIKLQIKNAGATSPFTGEATGPDIPESGVAGLENITITNEESDMGDIQLDTSGKPINVIDNNIIAFETENGIKQYNAITDENQTVTIKVKLSELDGNLKNIIFSNKNTSRDVLIKEISITDPDAPGEYKPVNPISTASDAEFEFDGIKITRSKNEVDDLISGVTLNLQNEGGESQITIKPDKEEAKNSIINFVIEYNKLIDNVTLLTSKKEDTLDKLNYLFYGLDNADLEKAKENAEEKLGILKGDTTVMKIKSAVRRILYDAYQLSPENSYRLLSQIGISTNESGFSGYSADNMQGYLELDEKKLDHALETNMNFVKEIFGFDSDNDMVVDTGAGFRMHNLIQPYTKTGGILNSKLKGFDRQIASAKEDITDLEKELEKKEAEYKRKYYRMEGLMEEMQKNAGALDNLPNPSQQQ